MPAQLIDGNLLAAQIKDHISAQIEAFKARGIALGLAVVLVGDDPASQVYVSHKVKDCEQVGIHSVLIRLPADITEVALLLQVESLNSDPSIHGILVQMPVPKHIDSQKVIAAINPTKDVDGFHVVNAGALAVGLQGFWPCTPHGAMKMLESIKLDLRGKHAVVIGRSNIVGKPMAQMLLNQSATVTICHSATTNLKELCLQADVIVAAVGKVNIVTADMVKKGAVVIDVGMNRNTAGKLCGDVDFDAVRAVAGYITPVPGGVGPMTRAMLLVNTLSACMQQTAAATDTNNKTN
jgi:methylenetetrahydrofolate dehydrogenase (NADP+) / methenyltetrahydrofolate cyclohydrolase